MAIWCSSSSSSSNGLVVFAIVICLFSLPTLLTVESRLVQLKLPADVTGADSILFGVGNKNEGPYITVADGRVLRWVDVSTGLVDFAQTSPERTKELCDGNTNQDLWPTCGRPLGMVYAGGDNVYIVDPYYGLMRLNSDAGGVATPLANSVDGQSFRFLTDVTIFGGKIYFTDASEVYEPRNATEGMETGDTTGRLLAYDLKTSEVTVLLRNLSWPVGVLGFKESLYISEYTGKRVRRYVLGGDNSGTDTVVATFDGKPTRMFLDTFPEGLYVAVNFENDQTSPPTISPRAVRITSDGIVPGQKNLDFDGGFVNHVVSDLEKFSAISADSGMFVVSPTTNFIGLYQD